MLGSFDVFHHTKLTVLSILEHYQLLNKFGNANSRIIKFHQFLRNVRANRLWPNWFYSSIFGIRIRRNLRTKTSGFNFKPNFEKWKFEQIFDAKYFTRRGAATSEILTLPMSRDEINLVFGRLHLVFYLLYDF